MPEPGLTGTGTYLDDIDESDVEAGTRRIVVHGTPVDMAVHGEVFRRTNWERYREPGTQDFDRTWSRPTPPSIPPRDATAAEMTPDASKLLSAAVAAGLEARALYAVSGEDRGVRRPKGRCACGAVTRVYANSGKVFPHPLPNDGNCTGTSVVGGACSKCGKKVVAKKSGEPRAHRAPDASCPNEEFPEEMLQGEPIPRDESVVVTVKRIGVAMWVNRSISAAYAVIDGRIQKSSVDDLIEMITSS